MPRIPYHIGKWVMSRTALPPEWNQTHSSYEDQGGSTRAFGHLSRGGQISRKTNNNNDLIITITYPKHLQC